MTTERVSAEIKRLLNHNIVGLTIVGAPSQAANLQEWQSSAGAVVASISASGIVTTTQGINATGGYANSFGGSSISGAIIGVSTAAAGNNGIVVRGAASQTADLQQWQTSAGVATTVISSAGTLYTNNSPYFAVTPYASNATGYVRLSTPDYRWLSGLGLLSDSSGNPRLTLHGPTAAQFSMGAEALSVTSANYIGIGTSAPLTQLDVVSGSAAITIGIDWWKNAATRRAGIINFTSNKRGSESNTPVAAIEGYDEYSGSAFEGSLRLYTLGNGTLSERLRITQSGNVGIGLIAPTAMLHVENNAAAKVGFIVKGAASQSANIQEWQNSSGGVLGGVASGGGVFFVRSSAFANTAVSINTGTTTNVGIVIRSEPSQTANIQEWQDSTGTNLAYITNSGNVVAAALLTSGTLAGQTLRDFNATGSFLSLISAGAIRVNTRTSTNIGLEVRGVASQSVDLQQWQDSTGGVLGSFSSSGSFTVRPAATQDAVILAGRAGGTSSYGVTITPTTLTANRTLTLADGNTILQSGTMATTGGSEVLTNKSLSDSTTFVVDNTDNTKRLQFDITGTTGVTGIFQTAFTTAKTVTFQDVAGTVYVSGGTDVSLADGGTNASLTASNGGIVYSTATAMAILAGTATAGQILRSGASGAPSWSTATYPATATTAGQLLRANGTNWVGSTATYPDAATSTGTILRADGTNWVATTATYPTTTTINQILFSSAANVISGIATANNQVLVTNASGVPAFSGTLPSGVTASSLTSVGTLSALTVSGTVTAGTGFTVAGTTASLSVQGLNGYINFHNALTAGSYNSIVAANDRAIIFTNGTVSQGALTIAPWSASSIGIRIDASGSLTTIYGATTINGTSIPTSATLLTSTSTSSSLTSVGTLTALTVNGTFTNQVGGISVLSFGTDANGSIELGKVNGSTSTPFIDFHSGATAVDYDTRIIASGGTGSNGGGTLNIVGAALTFNSNAILTSTSTSSALTSFGTSPTITTPSLTLSTTSSTTDARISWDTTNKKIQVGNGTISLDFVSSNIPGAGTAVTLTTNNYNLVIGDKDKLIEVSNTVASTVTIPLNSSAAYPIGTQIMILQTGTGQVTVQVTSGVTLNATPQGTANTAKLRAQWSSCTLIKRATDTWVAVGDLVA